MKMKNLFNWYFNRRALPYWCVVIFDLTLALFGALFVLWLRHPATEIMRNWELLFHTFMVFGAFNLIGARIFHTYSGILRLSQFVDLLRILEACCFSYMLSLIFNFISIHEGWEDIFYAFTGRMITSMYLMSLMFLCASRVFIRQLFDNVLVSRTAPHSLIYGTFSGAIAITNTIKNTKPVQFIISGYVGDDQEHYSERLMGKRVYSIHEDLKNIILQKQIKAFFVSSLKHNNFVNNKKLQDILIEADVKIYIAQNMEEWIKQQDPKKAVQMREIKIEDLLPRDEIEVNMEKVGALLRGKKVLITGSAGSIGSEMVRQIAYYKPAEMMLIDQAETPQHDIRLMMKNDFPDIKAHTVVTSICKESRMEEIFHDFQPDYVFHAAAYKHVPMMEDNPSESVQNNVWGTKIIADLSVKYNVKKFVMVSTDKAVNPTNVMGCSKRICEIYIQSLDKAIKDGKVKGITQFVTTRFGNVLGSNGSVIPLFRKQLAAGGPLTVTHPEIIRYFMLIPEACKLVLEAGTHGNGGEIFVFDMGEPVRIADLAKRMIKLSGAKDVQIKYTGLREGEKLYEEVLNENENTLPSFHKKIRIAQVRNYEYEDAERKLEELRDIALKYDDMETVREMKIIVPEYISKNSRYEVLDKANETTKEKIVC